MITYNKYINKIDHTWYDSSNLVYSACYDTLAENKILKVVFKGGRTYLYKDVSPEDYLMLKGATSNGEQFNRHIVKKYKGVRISDTDLEKLEELKKQFIAENQKIEEALTNLSYHMEINEKTGEFRLKLNDKVIYEGIEGNVSIVNLFASMHILYSTSEMTEPMGSANDFINQEIV